MCYSGRCRYETPLGDCTIHNGQYPDDALCNEDTSIEDSEEDEIKKKTVEELFGWTEYGGGP